MPQASHVSAVLPADSLTRPARRPFASADCRCTHTCPRDCSGPKNPSSRFQPVAYERATARESSTTRVPYHPPRQAESRCTSNYREAHDDSRDWPDQTRLKTHEVRTHAAVTNLPHNLV